MLHIFFFPNPKIDKNSYMEQRDNFQSELHSLRREFQDRDYPVNNCITIFQLSLLILEPRDISRL